MEALSVGYGVTKLFKPITCVALVKGRLFLQCCRSRDLANKGTTCNSKVFNCACLFTAQQYVKSVDGLKRDFFVQTFDKDGVEYACSLRVHFSYARSRNQSLFVSSGFDNFSDFDKKLSNSSAIKIRIFHVFPNEFLGL